MLNQILMLFYCFIVYTVFNVIRSDVVSASDITPMDHWLNVWCIWHTKVETLQEFRSHHRIGWIIHFRETCVSRSLTFHLETKMAWRQIPSRKKKAVVFKTVTMSAYLDQLNAGLDMLVKWPHGRSLANETCHAFQIFSRQSEGLATRD